MFSSVSFCECSCKPPYRSPSFVAHFLARKGGKKNPILGMGALQNQDQGLHSDFREITVNIKGLHELKE